MQKPALPKSKTTNVHIFFLSWSQFHFIIFIASRFEQKETNLTMQEKGGILTNHKAWISRWKIVTPFFSGRDVTDVTKITTRAPRNIGLWLVHFPRYFRLDLRRCLRCIYFSREPSVECFQKIFFPMKWKFIFRLWVCGSVHIVIFWMDVALSVCGIGCGFVVMEMSPTFSSVKTVTLSCLSSET